MLITLTKIFGTRTKAQEILLLLKDAKPVVRQGFYTSELPAVEQFCQDNHLFIYRSKFKVLLNDKSAYSNSCVRIPEDDPRPGMYFVYISKDEHSALLACYAEMMCRHKELGRLLGYPECCIEYFYNNFTASKTDLQLPPTNPWTNLNKRAEDYVLLSHFPCNPECKESIAMAQKFHALIAKADKEWAEELIKKLG